MHRRSAWIHRSNRPPSLPPPLVLTLARQRGVRERGSLELLITITILNSTTNCAAWTVVVFRLHLCWRCVGQHVSLFRAWKLKRVLPTFFLLTFFYTRYHGDFIRMAGDDPKTPPSEKGSGMCYLFLVEIFHEVVLHLVRGGYFASPLSRSFITLVAT